MSLKSLEIVKITEIGQRLEGMSVDPPLCKSVTVAHFSWLGKAPDGIPVFIKRSDWMTYHICT